MISTALKELYASGGDDVRIQAITISPPSSDPIHLVNGYVHDMLGVDGELKLHEPCGINIELPTKDNSGNQTLRFAIGVLDHDRVNQVIEQVVESGAVTYLTYREYLASDKLAPAISPIRMSVQGGVFAIDELSIEGSYFDMLNVIFNRQRYTIDLAPGVKWMT